ncbi:MAG: response regulator [Syntrophobacterales bacterium]|jgi:response regulator RpfG family c-di-GMP phosphodiesterase|nr:response regulator [Syntrophobacterales bacterium]
MVILNKILFVDDDPEILQSVQRILRGKFEVSVAASGSEGLSKVEEEGPFAVVVSDLRMPFMDGVAFLEQLGKSAPDTVRIMLTGYANLEAAVRAVNEGHVFHILTKPCEPEVLIAALHEGIRHHQLLQTEREYYALKKLHEGLDGVVLALVRLVEIRDPYTAGHQSRVAQLSAAVSQELGLPEERVKQIELSASIHDLGKILVPAEYLSKPGTLRRIEMDIVRMHSQVGHDILEPINFNFPLHKIVLQHHERLDGSGYPQGLKGEDILLEARILAVADVVEAMSSHRPYRPSMPLKGAMEEIRRQRGIFYDAQVVDICLDLFERRNWKFSPLEKWRD